MKKKARLCPVCHRRSLRADPKGALRCEKCGYVNDMEAKGR